MKINSIIVSQSEYIQGEASNEDTKFASSLCAEDGTAIAKFQNTFCDEVYFIASRFNNRGIREDSWEYRTKTGYTIRVDDDVADSYIWLVHQAMRKSCSYKGSKGASFSTYIITVLNSSFTFKDWLRWKTGDTGYVPKCIRILSSNHESVFLYLRRNVSIDQILEKMTQPVEEVYRQIEDIRMALSQEGLIDLITNQTLISIDTEYPQSENLSTRQEIMDQHSLDPSTAPDMNEIRQFLNELLVSLRTTERRILLLYWKENLTVDQIFSLTTTDQIKMVIDDLHFNTPKDIYPFITRILKDLSQTANQKFPDIVQDYEIDTSKLKTLLKVYLNEFEQERQN
jgi:RNA polymerase sigma factor (sigma-70 family)